MATETTTTTTTTTTATTTTTIIATIPEWIETMRYIKISLLALMFILIFCGNTFVLVALNVSLKQKFFFCCGHKNKLLIFQLPFVVHVFYY